MRICPNCNSEVNSKDKRRKFCDRKCQSEFYSKIKEISCPCCNKTFKQKESNQKYCSRKCSGLSQPKKQNPKKYYCIRCRKHIGTGFRNKRTTCDKCNKNIKDWSKTTLKELKNGRDINQYHARLRDLSRREYERSSKPKRCCNCGWAYHYHICHIKPVADFNENQSVAEVNHIDNLTALCLLQRIQ